MKQHLKRWYGILFGLTLMLGLMVGLPATAFADGEHTHDDITFTAWTDALAEQSYNDTEHNASNSLPKEAGNYYLTANVTLTGTWTPPDGETKLCLSGHTISANGGSFPVITVNNAAKTLDIYDENNAGAITGSNYTGNGGGLSITAGHVTLHGGSIQGNRASNGGGVCVNGANAWLGMTGGSIQYNEGYGNTGGVLLAGSGRFTMSGGTIQYNVGKNFGGIGTSSAKMEFSGDVQIKNNYFFPIAGTSGKIKNTNGTYSVNTSGGMPANVKMANANDRISVVGALADTASIGVWSDGKRQVTNSTSTDNNVAARFAGDVAGMQAEKLDSDGQIWLRYKSVSYRKGSWNNTTKTVDFETKSVSDYIVVTEASTSWTTGNWYVVNSNVTIASRITVSGTVNLILCDGCKLTASKGIQHHGSNKLNIYAQSENNKRGILKATSGDDYFAGIGGNNTHGSGKGGILTIHGGDISATGRQLASGIGGGNRASLSSVTIFGGKVTATGGKQGAGIGGGDSAAGGAVNIYGGTIKATGGDWGAGIGGGDAGSGGKVNIYGGVVTAKGAYEGAAGIGAGDGGKNGGTVNVYGGNVTATGADSKTSGIGAKSGKTQGTLKIADGMVVRAGSSSANQPCADYPAKRGRYVHIWPHTHNLSYSASGKTLKGTCVEKSTTCNFINNQFTLTINASDADYNGQAHGAALAAGGKLLHGVSEFTAITGLAVSDITYWQGETQLSGAPVNVGEYTAKLTLNHSDTEYTISSGKYKIKPINMTADAADVTVSYDGQPHGITVEVTKPASGASIKYGTAADACTQDASPTITNVAESPFIVYYKVTADNYNDKTGSATITINKADQTAPDAPTEARASGNSITLTAITNGEYSKDGTTWQTSPTFNGLTRDTPYTFYQRLKEDTNHNASESSPSATISTDIHEHSWSYQVSGATITATCTADGCKLPEVDGMPTATLTIGAPTTDSGEAELTSDPEGAFDDFTISIEYRTKNGSSWGDATTIPPVTAGIHKASITLDTATASVTYGLNCIAYVNAEGSHGTVSGSANATVGATITPTITPETGYELDTLTVTPAEGSGVSADDITVDGGTFVMPEADVTVSATFRKINSAITVTQPENGTVTVKKGDTAVTTADYDDTLTLGNSPAAGYALSSYSVTKTGDSTTAVPVTDGTFTMPEYPVTVTGTFAPIDYAVAFSAMTNGEVSTGKTSGLHIGDEVTLTITPATGYQLDTLTVKDGDNQDVAVTNNKFTMPASDVTVGAAFKKINSAITVTQPENGTVTVKKGDTAVTAADYDDTLTLGNSPAAGYALSSYSVTKTGDSTTAVSVTDGTFTMPEYPVTVTGTFAPIDYAVAFSAMTNGEVSTGKTSGLRIGDEVTLTVTPATGYQLDTLTVKDGDNQDVAVTNNKFTMPASDVIVTGSFTPIDYTVTIAETVNGAVTTTTTGTAHIGDEITLTVTPDEDFGLKAITTTSGTLVQTDLDPETGVMTYVLTMGAGDAAVTAEFSALTTYTIFYNAGGSPEAVSIRPAGNDGAGWPMTSSARMGDINCWSNQVLNGTGWQNLSFAVKEGNEEWIILDIPVVNDVPNSLAAGSAVAIEGDVNAFAVAFVWGENMDTDSRYYLVTSNTASVDVPNLSDTEIAAFTGWTYLVPSARAGREGEEVTVNKTDGSTTTVPIDKIAKTTIVSAVWTPKNCTVSFDPDNGNAKTTQSVVYGNKVTPPAAPTKAGCEFAGWVLAGNAVEKVGDKTLQFSAGTAFDFNNASIINDLSLKARWKHVHAYTYLQLDNPIFGGAFNDYLDYKGQLHIKLCTDIDDYNAEAHNFVNGKCACGASVQDDKVTLSKYVGDEKSEIKAVKNGIVSIKAPQKQGSKIFSKWQYSADTTNGKNGTWYDLSSMRGVAFAIPANLSTRAVYENEPFKLTINSFKYKNNHIAFQFDYSVPDGFTVVDGGLMLGDNVRMKFWDCTFKSFFGNQYEPSLRDAVSVYGGGMIASKMVNYQTINEPGLATLIKRPLSAYGKTGTAAIAWQTYTSEGYKKAIRSGVKVKGYDQAKYPTYAAGYIICKNNKNGGYVGFMTNAISATLNKPNNSNVTIIPVS